MVRFLVIANCCSSIRGSTAYLVPAFLYACLPFLHSSPLSGHWGRSTVAQVSECNRLFGGLRATLTLRCVEYVSGRRGCTVTELRYGALVAGRRVPSVPSLTGTLTTPPLGRSPNIPLPRSLSILCILSAVMKSGTRAGCMGQKCRQRAFSVCFSYHRLEVTTAKHQGLFTYKGEKPSEIKQPHCVMQLVRYWAEWEGIC